MHNALAFACEEALLQVAFLTVKLHSVCPSGSYDLGQHPVSLAINTEHPVSSV